MNPPDERKAESPPVALETLRAGLFGLLIGDALGVPYEFHRARDLPPGSAIEFEPPAGFRRAHAGVAPGTWSDDGAQALCLLASWLYRGALDLEDLGRRFRNWFDHGYLAAGGRAFDIGIQTSRALRNLEAGMPAEQAGPSGERANGNGSLMRVLPLALIHPGSEAQLFADACRQSLVTHGHPRAQICCGLYCLWARAEARRLDDPWQVAVDQTRQILTARPAWRQELERHIQPDGPPKGKGSGYVVDSLHSARLALQQSSYEAVVKTAVSLGDDTDTTAAVAGGIAGIRWGMEGIPTRWLEALVDRHLVDELLVRV